MGNHCGVDASILRRIRESDHVSLASELQRHLLETLLSEWGGSGAQAVPAQAKRMMYCVTILAH